MAPTDTSEGKSTGKLFTEDQSEKPQSVSPKRGPDITLADFGDGRGKVYMRKKSSGFQPLIAYSIPRNSLCPCGSNIKYKKCCLKLDRPKLKTR